MEGGLLIYEDGYNHGRFNQSIVIWVEECACGCGSKITFRGSLLSHVLRELKPRREKD